LVSAKQTDVPIVNPGEQADMPGGFDDLWPGLRSRAALEDHHIEAHHGICEIHSCTYL
jgi:hypothetical protein